MNYKTVLTTHDKLFSKIKNYRLTCWSDMFNNIGDTESGFRESTTCLVMLQSVIASCLNTKRRLQ